MTLTVNHPDPASLTSLCTVASTIHNTLLRDQQRAVTALQHRSAVTLDRKRRLLAHERVVAYDTTVAVLLQHHLPAHEADLQTAIARAQDTDLPTADRLIRIRDACVSYIHHQAQHDPTTSLNCCDQATPVIQVVSV